MQVTVPSGATISTEQIAYLDGMLLDNKGRIKLFPAAFYHDMKRDHLLAWLNVQARYVVPTTELVWWLRRMIGSRKAIEVGAGNADVGHHVGIHMTDSYSQSQNPACRLIYELQGQPMTLAQPRVGVQKLDAVEAVIKYRPDVVVACYVTQKAYEHSDPTKGGNMFGPEEEDIVSRVETYIHVGNQKVHKDKRILRHEHTVYCPDWLITRASEPDKNCIYVWHGLQQR